MLRVKSNLLLAVRILWFKSLTFIDGRIDLCNCQFRNWVHQPRLFAIVDLEIGCINHQPPLQRGISMIQLHPVQIVGEDQTNQTGNERNKLASLEATLV